MDLFCRVATAFSKDGGIDEEAYRAYLQRFVDAKVGVYLASAGSGEGNSLTDDELRQVYRVGYEVCKGKVPINGNPPERPNVRDTLAQIKLAIEGGCEVVNIYGPPGWHAFRPNDDEYVSFFDELLGTVKHPVALAPNPTLGYSPSPDIIADICYRHHQIVGVHLVNQDDDYFVALKDRLKRDISLWAPLAGSLTTVLLGASGVISVEANLVPKTLRRYIDFLDQKKFIEAARVYADLRRVTQHVKKWARHDIRWIKMAMKVFKLPGGEGGVRGPHKMPPEAEIKKFTEGLLKLRVAEIDEMAKAAGISS